MSKCTKLTLFCVPVIPSLLLVMLAWSRYSENGILTSVIAFTVFYMVFFALLVDPVVRVIERNFGLVKSLAVFGSGLALACFQIIDQICSTHFWKGVSWFSEGLMIYGAVALGVLFLRGIFGRRGKGKQM